MHLIAPLTALAYISLVSAERPLLHHDISSMIRLPGFSSQSIESAFAETLRSKLKALGLDFHPGEFNDMSCFWFSFGNRRSKEEVGIGI
ncbi:hypothetical protein BDZ45DRAFT_681850 [Acephala macrosclerotiorum]|nr:hypothetical protein BDZ45DRAFT_681850 [Acephala macrosclerotiorum]